MHRCRGLLGCRRGLPSWGLVTQSFSRLDGLQLSADKVARVEDLMFDLFVVVTGYPKLVCCDVTADYIEGLFHSIEVGLKTDVILKEVELVGTDCWELELDGEDSFRAKRESI